MGAPGLDGLDDRLGVALCDVASGVEGLDDGVDSLRPRDIA
ncbi:MAG: hypothetical protein ABEH88_00075 [Halobacteriales archaeon]